MASIALIGWFENLQIKMEHARSPDIWCRGVMIDNAVFDRSRSWANGFWVNDFRVSQVSYVDKALRGQFGARSPF